ncbi:FkbM family methyltransferase [Ensifer sp. ENS12]|uniref:FkbM family methyltransferase n=1 Tax=Ensifer sp. ENS12 TaxID=2854774 RepID=UPI001C45F229|nr:FkbM family methyltransferase [Ensifer sp. ENS12]MBV7522603.1 FkbM family methyltransferase [Ensifer sp. ENS12]
MSQLNVDFHSFEEALVRSCYRVLLGREPEQAVIDSHSAPKVSEEQERAVMNIVRSMVASEEYQAKVGGLREAAPDDGSLLLTANLVIGERAKVEDSIRRRCMTSYLGNNTALCRMLGRYHLFVDTNDVGFTPHVMHRGIWEMPLTEFMVRNIKPGMRVLDIGGNFGYYSILMSDLVQDTGHCDVFEPNVLAAGLLKKSIAVNGFSDRARVFEIALSDVTDRSMKFYIPTNEPKNARLMEGYDDKLATEGRFVDVPVTTVDDMAGHLGWIDFIKIDAEGAELEILRGMSKTIREQRPSMMIELNCGRGYDARPVLEELWSVYGKLQYLGGDGRAHLVGIDAILKQKVGEDWLIYVERPRS